MRSTVWYQVAYPLLRVALRGCGMRHAFDKVYGIPRHLAKANRAAYSAENANLVVVPERLRPANRSGELIFGFGFLHISGVDTVCIYIHPLCLRVRVRLHERAPRYGNDGNGGFGRVLGMVDA